MEFKTIGAAKADETNICAQCICDTLLDAAEHEPDKVRDVLGSVAFRELEAYRARKAAKEAAFTEWFHEMTAVEKPFG